MLNHAILLRNYRKLINNWRTLFVRYAMSGPKVLARSNNIAHGTAESVAAKNTCLNAKFKIIKTIVSKHTLVIFWNHSD